MVYRGICAAAVGYFLWNIVQFYIPGQGFSCLINFGGQLALPRIKELQSLDYHVYRDSFGYDGQYYAQLAVKPDLASPDLAAAMDDLPYRARRILFSGVAHWIGLGRPAWALQAYALENVAVWLLLAWLLWRWFPPTGPGNLVRWLGVLFAWGLTASVRNALTDGPSLLLIAWGIALLESGRSWTSACVLGISGLGRETNLLALPALAPEGRGDRTESRRAALRLALAAVPLAAWLGYIGWVCGGMGAAGARNFTWPLGAYCAKWSEAWHLYQTRGWDWMIRGTLAVLVSLTVQWLVLLLRPRWRSAWWRMGAAFAALMVFLGPAVWEGYPGAAVRVLLPMTLAFNVLVPRGLRWWPVLLLGNLSALTVGEELRPPAWLSYRLEGPVDVWKAPNGRAVEVGFGPTWYVQERSMFEYWRWSSGAAAIDIHNPQPVPVQANLRFDLRTQDERRILVYQGATLRWVGTVNHRGTAVSLPGIRLAPGDNAWSFKTDRPPVGTNLRPVTFNLRNLVIEAVRLEGRPPSTAPPPS